MDLCDRTAHELSLMLARGETSCSEIAESVLGRVSAVEHTVGSYIALDADGAMKRARALDSGRPARARPGPLWGIPLAIKDNICTRELPTTCASRILEAYMSPYDATAVKRLLGAGAVVIGKTNLDEFGMGSSTEHSAAAVTRNPWNPGRVPGGSSGGSAAAVCAGEAIVALGSDTGGSVRLPAAFCGVAGLRPTYGAVSRHGLVAYSSSMDQIGFFGKDALDCASLLSVVAGPDGMDSTAITHLAHAPAAGRTCGTASDSAASSIKGKTVGVPFAFLEMGVDEQVVGCFEGALEVLRDLDAEVVPVDLVDPSYAVAAYYVIADCEASSNLARFDGARYGRRVSSGSIENMYSNSRSRFLGTEVKRRIILGAFALSAGYYDQYYLKASRARNLISQDLLDKLNDVDLIAMPTAPGQPFVLGEKLTDPLEMYLTDVFTVAPSLAGLPAVSLPMGLSSEGLPLGLQLIGRPQEDYALTDAAGAYQGATGHHNVRPSLEALRVKSPGEEDSARV